MFLKTVKLTVSNNKVIGVEILDDPFTLTNHSKYTILTFPHFFNRDVNSTEELTEQDYKLFSSYDNHKCHLDFSQYLNIPKD